ncbi:MAG TPA: hypothetical protein VGF97_14905 [Rhizomicrobium sp.]
MTIVAVTGLAREARLVAGPDIVTIVSAGDIASLERRLAGPLPQGIRGMLSVGICGALSPALKVGDIVVASAICYGGKSFEADRAWTREIARRLPGSVVAPIAGSDAIIADRVAKERLYTATGASAVDMESGSTVRAARARNLPFAALRVVSDGAKRNLAPAACLALGSDGRPDLKAVLQSVVARPQQIPALIRTAFEAERAFAVLFRCRDVFHASLAAANLGQLAVDMS